MTTIDIFNRALDLCGTTNAVAITDATKEARICLRNYELCRKFILRSHPWNFAIKRVLLVTPDATPPPFDFTNRYPLPSDYLRATNVWSDVQRPWSEDDWRIEQGFILSDDSQIQLSYVYDVTDFNLWDPCAFDAMSHYLAWIICYSITQSQSQKDQLFRDLDKILKKAKQMDSIEDPKKDLDIDVWMRSRVGPSQGFVRDPMT